MTLSIGPCFRKIDRTQRELDHLGSYGSGHVHRTCIVGDQKVAPGKKGRQLLHRGLPNRVSEVPLHVVPG